MRLHSLYNVNMREILYLCAIERNPPEHEENGYANAEDVQQYICD